MEKRLHDFIPEIKDLYTVTSDGEFFSDNTGKMKTRNRAGTEYQIINFMKQDGTKKTYRAHRLVLMAFQPCENMDKLQVNHIDGNKKNNKLENLEWCTSSENQKHAFKLGLQKARSGEQSNFSKLTKKDIKMIFEMYHKGFNVNKIAQKVHCSSSNVYRILSGKTWQSLKFND